jgi:predicted ATPase
MMQRAFLQQHIGDRAATLRCADETLEVAAEHGFPFRGAQATIVRGWALGDAGELRAGLTAYRATGAEMEVPYYLGMLAEILGGDEGLAVVDEALAASGTWPFFFQAELHRVRGDLLRDPADAAGAYRAALAIATGQRAPSLVLRTTIRLCRAGAPGARDDLRAALGAVEGGSGTPDVIEARALLG